MKQRAKLANASCIGFDIMPAEIAVAITADCFEPHTSLLLMIMNAIRAFNIKGAVLFGYIGDTIRLCWP